MKIIPFKLCFYRLGNVAVKNLHEYCGRRRRSLNFGAFVLLAFNDLCRIRTHVNFAIVTVSLSSFDT